MHLCTLYSACMLNYIGDFVQCPGMVMLQLSTGTSNACEQHATCVWAYMSKVQANIYKRVQILCVPFLVCIYMHAV